jgi:hypothetical protein
MSTRIRARVERLELRHITQPRIVVVENKCQAAAIQRPGVFVVITGVPQRDYCADLV